MTEFRLKIELDPQTEDREALARWPRKPVMPDISTVASGWISLELDSRPVLYENGQRVERSDNPDAGRIGDYVIMFLQRLLDAARQLGDGQAHVAEFGDNPACLVIQKSDGHVRVAYRENPSDPDALHATPTEAAFLSAVKQAASHYLEELYTINGALKDHPDVASIRQALRAL